MRNRASVFVAVAAVGALMVLGGCPSGGQGGGGPGGATVAPLTAEQIHSAIKGTWKLQAIGGTPVVPASFPTPTLEKREPGRIGGQSSVNHWGAAIDEAALGEGDVRMGAITSTLMAGSLEAMQVEHVYLQALAAARKIDLEALKGGTLRITDVGGDEVLRFVR